MRLRLRPLFGRWARRAQVAYAQAIRSAPPPQGGGAPGGSLAARVLGAGLVEFRRWGFVFRPGRLGASFRWWWRGTRRQPGRGRRVAIDASRLARELEIELARQLQREDQRGGSS